MCDLKDPELGFGYEGPQSLSEVRIAFYRRLCFVWNRAAKAVKRRMREERAVDD